MQLESICIWSGQQAQSLCRYLYFRGIMDYLGLGRVRKELNSAKIRQVLTFGLDCLWSCCLFVLQGLSVGAGLIPAPQLLGCDLRLRTNLVTGVQALFSSQAKSAWATPNPAEIPAWKEVSKHLFPLLDCISLKFTFQSNWWEFACSLLLKQYGSWKLNWPQTAEKWTGEEKSFILDRNLKSDSDLEV